MSTTLDIINQQHIGIPNPNVKALHDELAQIVKEKELVLPAEHQLKEWMEDRVKTIQKQVRNVKASQQAGGAAILDPVVLRWRHALFVKGLPVPRVALINPFKSQYLSFHRNVEPSGALSYYQDVVEALRQKERESSRDNIRLTFTYNGVIPNETRELIRDAGGKYEEVYMLVDSPREAWEYTDTKKVRPPKVRHWDPIVLGYSAGVFVVLGQFDPTPLELYVAQEFSTKQLTTGS